MSLSTVLSRSLCGLHAPLVTVEVHLSPGLPQFSIVGLADTEVKEARERVRAALLESGFEFPFHKRITVNLAPADLPKESGRFDLPMALGILHATGQLAQAPLQSLELAGELSLSGMLRPIRGALAMALAARQSGNRRTLVLPMSNAAEAQQVPGLQVHGTENLADLVQWLREGAPPRHPTANTGAFAAGATPSDPALGAAEHEPLDLSDVRGQTLARRALEVAAAGEHSLLMWGPPGCGKTMLARRLCGLLPAMSAEDALTSASLLSLSGAFDMRQWAQRPFRAPHHHSSAVALTGGGLPPRPGEVSLAHAGVLFLDELPEFSRQALESLREPLESGQVLVSRSGYATRFPARFQLVAAMNPCPCGYWGHPSLVCRCRPAQILQYQSRISGPLWERIDLWVEMSPQGSADTPPKTEESSALVAARCRQALDLQMNRQGQPNARLALPDLLQQAALGTQAQAALDAACQRLSWSLRSRHRCLRVARTLADLSGSPRIEVPQVEEAISWRRALSPPRPHASSP